VGGVLKKNMEMRKKEGERGVNVYVEREKNFPLE
jgi:hypothetical protein